MKSKHIVTIMLILCVISMVLMLSGCKSFPYPYLHDSSEINEIKLVIKTSGFNYSTQGEYEELAIIEDIDTFLEEFNQVEFGRMIIGDPELPDDGVQIILIIYNNGDLEGIGYDAQFVIQNGECRDGRIYCNQEEFEQFFAKWLEK